MESETQSTRDRGGFSLGHLTLGVGEVWLDLCGPFQRRSREHLSPCQGPEDLLNLLNPFTVRHFKNTNLPGCHRKSWTRNARRRKDLKL